MLVDLHTHTHHSDGTDSPSELMHAARTAGLGLIGLTDHDTDAGWAEAAELVSAAGVGLVRGVEVTCSLDGISVHMLSYLHDPDNAEFAELLADNRSLRPRRARAMIERLSADFPITWDSVLEVAGDPNTIGRPHMADALIRAGVFENRDQVFAGPLANSSPYYIHIGAPEPGAVVERIVAAGGVAVIAHPFMAKRGRTVSDEVIADLAVRGMAGIEADHRDHSSEERERARRLARELGLLVTGASDYHGLGKPNRLGEGLTAPEVVEEIAGRGTLPILMP